MTLNPYYGIQQVTIRVGMGAHAQFGTQLRYFISAGAEHTKNNSE